MSRSIQVFVFDDFGDDRNPIAGSSNELPNMPFLDGLSSACAIYPNFYVEPACSTTRAAAMTGLHPTRTGVGEAYKPHDDDLYQMPADIDTVFRAAARRGYATAAVGKWHMGYDINDPYRRGVQRAHTTTFNIEDYWNWTSVVDGIERPENEYNTRKLVQWVNEERSRLTGPGCPPYLLWVGFQAAHEPVHAAPADMRTTPPTDDLHKWLGGCESIDWALRRTMMPTQAPAPITFIFADNGTPAAFNCVPTGQGKGTTGEGGVNVTLMVHCPGVVVPGVRDDLVSVTDLFATIQEAIGDEAPRPADSISFWPNLVGPTAHSPRLFACAEKFAPNQAVSADSIFAVRQRMAVRHDGWKLRQWLAPKVQESFHYLPTAPAGEDGDAVTPPESVAVALRAELVRISG